ncbi:MAG: hypothetical protein V8S97_02555 [Oscillospiraceae bacterium]
MFYLGDEGAEYTFTPENGCTVTVARSTVDDSAMSFNGFTSEGVITDTETGAVTVTNLTSGRHIVRVEKDGVATYQVITARGVRYDLLDADGNVLPAHTEIKAGDQVKVQFHDLVSPKEKFPAFTTSISPCCTWMPRAGQFSYQSRHRFRCV